MAARHEEGHTCCQEKVSQQMFLLAKGLSNDDAAESGKGRGAVFEGMLPGAGFLAFMLFSVCGMNPRWNGKLRCPPQKNAYLRCILGSENGGISNPGMVVDLVALWVGAF